MNGARQFARFVVETQFEDLPRDVVDRYKVYVLDNIASGLIGSVQSWSSMIADMICESECKGVCTVIGHKWRTGQSGATLVNGAMIGGFETDHSSAPASGHPGSTVYPGVMAMAEAEHKDGKSFITAMRWGMKRSAASARRPPGRWRTVAGFTALEPMARLAPRSR